MAVSNPDRVMLGNAMAVAWWVGVIEEAIDSGRLPQLTAELAAALDELYRVVGIVYAEMPAEGSPTAPDDDQRDLARLLAAALRAPSRYAWGRRLHESFRERLRQVFDAGESPLPPEWPERSG